MQAPKPVQEWYARVRHDWEAFWRSDQGKAIQESDLAPLRRLFDLYDERERCQRELRKPGGRWIVGSMGQKRRSPMYDVLLTLDTKIHVLEDRFRMSPGARNIGGGSSDNGPTIPTFDDTDGDGASDGDRDLR